MRIQALLASATAALLTGGTAVHAKPAQPLAVIKYRPDDRLVLLPVKVRGRTEWFVFDSSSTNLVLDSRLTARLGLEARKSSSTTGAGAGAVGVKHVDPISVSVGPLSIRSEDPWSIDLSNVPIAKDVRGLIGADLWRRYVVQMNAERKTIAFYEPRTFRASRAERCLPLIVQGGRMFVEATLDVKPGLSEKHKLRIETGAEETVNDPILAQAAETQRTKLGNGLGEDFYAVSGKMNALHLGPFTIRDVWGPGGPGPSIGMEIFRRFVTTFDVSRGCLYLKPTRALADPIPLPPTGQ